jgi:hypothetical protein
MSTLPTSYIFRFTSLTAYHRLVVISTFAVQTRTSFAGKRPSSRFFRNSRRGTFLGGYNESIRMVSLYTVYVFRKSELGGKNASFEHVRKEKKSPHTYYPYASTEQRSFCSRNSTLHHCIVFLYCISNAPANDNYYFTAVVH